MSLPAATGGFIISAVLITLAGASGLFERLMDRVPVAIAAALLAGVLTRFGLDAALAAHGDPLLVGAMALVFVLGRRFWPRFAVPGVLVAGIAMAAAPGGISLADVQWGWARPVFVMPEFSVAAAIGLGLPLFIVTMASQNLPGVAAQRAAGVTAPVSPVIASTGLATLLLAPFGSFGLNLAAITAAICMGPEAHPDPKRRYIAPVAAGVFYLLIGLGGGAVVGLMAAFPHALVVARGRARAAGHDRRRAGVGAGGGEAPRRRRAHLPRDAVGREPGRHRRAVLGRRGRRGRAGCATLPVRAPPAR